MRESCYDLFTQSIYSLRAVLAFVPYLMIAMASSVLNFPFRFPGDNISRIDCIYSKIFFSVVSSWLVVVVSAATFANNWDRLDSFNISSNTRSDASSHACTDDA